jgi:hypothetical protein
MLVLMSNCEPARFHFSDWGMSAYRTGSLTSPLGRDRQYDGRNAR